VKTPVFVAKIGIVILFPESVVVVKFDPPFNV